MREIRFRCWDSEKKEMIFNFRMSSEGFVYIDDGLGIVPSDEFEIMQYTGLHDKNGKEVFEGDIVKDDMGHYLKPTEIKMDRLFWHDFVEYGLEPENIEVIGNIYMNLELLT